MKLLIKDDWIADLFDMTCRNINNGIIISFEKSGDSVDGKIKTVPLAMIQSWLKMPNSHDFLKETVQDAKKVFLLAYNESKNNLNIEKNQRPAVCSV